MNPIDVACVIHGNAYDWEYVNRLYSMVSRHLSRPVLLHVYTEHNRQVPSPYIKHPLIDWGVGGPKKSWWYKIQLFNSQQYSGPLLYFDLDVVIVRNIDWICDLPLDVLWGVRDFRYLWKPYQYNINSSIMWWDTTRFDIVWAEFNSQPRPYLMKKYHGDQDFINDILDQSQRHCFDQDKIKSWRWQCLDGGFDFRKRKYLAPRQGTHYDDKTCVMVFHGDPKPSDTKDPVIAQHWQ